MAFKSFSGKVASNSRYGASSLFTFNRIGQSVEPSCGRSKLIVTFSSGSGATDAQSDPIDALSHAVRGIYSALDSHGLCAVHSNECICCACSSDCQFDLLIVILFYRKYLCTLCSFNCAIRSASDCETSRMFPRFFTAPCSFT